MSQATKNRWQRDREKGVQQVITNVFCVFLHDIVVIFLPLAADTDVKRRQPAMNTQSTVSL